MQILLGWIFWKLHWLGGSFIMWNHPTYFPKHCCKIFEKYLKHQILSNDVEIFHGFTGLPFFIFSFPCHQRRFKLGWLLTKSLVCLHTSTNTKLLSQLTDDDIWDGDILPSLSYQNICIKHLHLLQNAMDVSSVLFPRINNHYGSIVFSFAVWWNKDVMTSGDWGRGKGTNYNIVIMVVRRTE